MSSSHASSACAQKNTKVVLAQATFRKVVKQELEILLQNDIERDIAVKQLLHRIVAATIQPTDEEVERVMKQFQMNRDDAIRALIVKQEIGRLKTQGFDALEAIQELTRKLQCRDSSQDAIVQIGCECKQMNDALCQQIENVSISSTLDGLSTTSSISAGQVSKGSCHSAVLLSKKRKLTASIADTQNGVSATQDNLDDVEKIDDKYKSAEVGIAQLVKRQKVDTDDILEKVEPKAVLDEINTIDTSKTEDKMTHGKDQVASIQTKYRPSTERELTGNHDSPTAMKRNFSKLDPSTSRISSPEGDQDSNYTSRRVSTKRPYTMLTSGFEDHEDGPNYSSGSNAYQSHSYIRHAKRHRK